MFARNHAAINSGAEFFASAGWGKTFNEKVYMGFEGRLGYIIASSESRETKNDLAGALRTSAGLMLGVAARVGYAVIDNGMLYFRAGVDWQQMEDKSTGFLAGEEKFTSAMFVPGLGFEWQPSDQLSFNIEAEHGFALNEHKQTVNMGWYTVTTKVGHSKTAMRVGVRYKFNMPAM